MLKTQKRPYDMPKMLRIVFDVEEIMTVSDPTIPTEDEEDPGIPLPYDHW